MGSACPARHPDATLVSAPGGARAPGKQVLMAGKLWPRSSHEHTERPVPKAALDLAFVKTVLQGHTAPWGKARLPVGFSGLSAEA